MSAPFGEADSLDPAIPEHSPVHRVARVRHELRRRSCVVNRVAALGPGFVRVQLAGEALRSFVSLSFNDHVKVFLPPSAGAAEGDRPLMRDFTPRAFDARVGTLDLEFALHDHGPASRWAATARVGDMLDIGGPRGSMIIPTDFDWHLLAGDESSLPAIARRLEELPEDVAVTALISTRDPADRRELSSRAALTMQWVDGHQPNALARAARAWFVPQGEGFAWAACEASEAAALREVMGGPLQLHRRRVHVSAYWKRGHEAHHQSIDA